LLLSLAPTHFLRRLHRLLRLHSQFVKIQHDGAFFLLTREEAGDTRFRPLSESLQYISQAR
jgi:hypothetical protein